MSDAPWLNQQPEPEPKPGLTAVRYVADDPRGKGWYYYRFENDDTNGPFNTQIEAETAAADNLGPEPEIGVGEGVSEVQTAVLIRDGLIAYKRLMATPPNTMDEISAAVTLADICDTLVDRIAEFLSP